MKNKISRTQKMIREVILLDMADAEIVFLSRKIKIQPLEQSW